MSLDLLVVLVAVVWGAVTGALLPRAAYRFSAPSGEAWRDRCPQDHEVLGWLGRARCGQCPAGQAPYGPAPSPRGRHRPRLRRPRRRHRDPSGVAVWLLLAPVGVLLAVVDLRVRRLPDPLTLPLAGAALVLLGLTALVPEHAGEWTTVLLGALALGGGYGVLFLINPAGMGFGDVKLALGAGAVLGWYGWATVMLGTFAGFLLGALYGGALVVARRAGRKTAIPFGPFLIAGAFLGVLAGAYAA